MTMDTLHAATMRQSPCCQFTLMEMKRSELKPGTIKMDQIEPEK